MPITPLAADGMAGPKTLASIDAFKSSFNEETIQNSELRSDEESFEAEPMPEIKGTEYVKGATAEAAPEKSLWSRVKGWFS